MSQSIVVVHGVGSPEPGSEITKVADAIGDKSIAMKISHLRSNRTNVPVGELIHQGEKIRLYELNWSHTVRPADGAWHTLGQLFCLLFAAMQIAQAGWDTGATDDKKRVDGPSRIGCLFRWVLVTITIWAPILAVTVILAEILEENHRTAASLVVLGIGFTVFVAARMLGKVDRHAASSGLCWAVAIAFIGLLVIHTELTRAILSPVTKSTVFIGIYLSGFLLFLGTIESFWRGKLARGTLRASSFRAAMYVIPFIVLAAAWPPVVFTFQFMIVDMFTALDGSVLTRAEGVYKEVAKGLPYPIVKLEIINLIAFVGAIFVLFAFFLIWSSALGSKFAQSQNWGGQFRRAVALWLLILILVGAVTIAPVTWETAQYYFAGKQTGNGTDLTGFTKRLVNFFKPDAGEDVSPLEFYRVSMWRVSAGLLFLIPAFTKMILVFMQIIFYICPDWSPLSTKGELLRQFENITNLARQHGGEAPIILAYSQGSKIATDALAVSKAPVDRLVTIGSPVDAIHQSFLVMPVPKHGRDWLNFYRNSDFIGGPIQSKEVTNSLIESNFGSSHFRYYREQSVLKAIGLA